MGRNKIKIEKISTKSNRQITFSKRKNGLIKKAYELSVLCDIDVVVICFSPCGKVCFFSRPKSVADTLLECVHKLEDGKKDQEGRIIIRNKDRAISLLQNVKSQDETEAKGRAVEEATRKEEGVYSHFPPENAYLYECLQGMKRQHARLTHHLRWFNMGRYKSTEFEKNEERLRSSLTKVCNRKHFLQMQSRATLKVEEWQANCSANTEAQLEHLIRISASRYNSNPQPPKLLQLQSQPQQQSMLMQRNDVMQQQTIEDSMQMQHELAALDKQNKGEMMMINPSPDPSNCRQQIEQEADYMQLQRELAPLNQNDNGNTTTTTQTSQQRTLEANQEQHWRPAFRQLFDQMDLGSDQVVEGKKQGATGTDLPQPQPQPEMNQDAIQTQPETEIRSSSPVNGLFGPPMIPSDDYWDYPITDLHPFQTLGFDPTPSSYVSIDDVENEANLDLAQVNPLYDFQGPSQ